MDERMRQLGREAIGGDVEAAARLLSERIRVGETSEGRVRVAAFLGDQRARILVPENEQGRIDVIDRDTLSAWGRQLITLPGLSSEERHELSVRSTLAITRFAFTLLPGGPNDEQYYHDTLNRAERWINLSDDERMASEFNENPTVQGGTNMSYSDIARDVGFSMFGYPKTDMINLPNSMGMASLNTVGYCNQLGISNFESIVENMQRSIQEELIPWLLSTEDPIQERMEEE